MRSKKVNEFIKSAGRGLDYEVRLSNRYSMLENYFPRISDKLNERFMANPFYDFLNENLQTHDWKKLKSQLLKRYGDSIDEIEVHDGNKADSTCIITIIFKSNFKRELIVQDPEFQNLLDFFNYFVTEARYHYAHIEPKYSEDATRHVYEDGLGIIYHIAKRRDLDSILENGLRCRGKSQERGEYRSFPERIYFIADSPNKLGIKEYLKKIAENVMDPDEEYVALRINLRNTNMKFYKDLAMRGYPDCYFMYNNIPPERIEKVIEL